MRLDSVCSRFVFFPVTSPQPATGEQCCTSQHLKAGANSSEGFLYSSSYHRDWGALPTLPSKQHFMLSRCYRANTFPQHMVIISLLLRLLRVRVCACLGRDGLQHQRKHEPRTQSGGFVPRNMKCIRRIVLYSGFYTL